MEWVAEHLGISTAAAWLVVAVALAQLSVQVFCLIDIRRRQAPAFGGRLVWAAAVVLGGTLGSITYLVLGRGPEREPASERTVPAAPRPGRERHDDADDELHHAVDLLYGGGGASGGGTPA